MTMIRYQQDDGGRARAGCAGEAGDCIVRATSILAAMPYRMAYERLEAVNDYAGSTVSPDLGVHKAAHEQIWRELGMVKVDLPKGARPTYTEAYRRYGDCIVKTEKHAAAIIMGALHDTWDGRTLKSGAERKALSVWTMPIEAYCNRS